MPEHSNSARERTQTGGVGSHRPREPLLAFFAQSGLAEVQIQRIEGSMRNEGEL
jgi:hypothetical protein